jgi:hypothetical protein
VEVEVTGTQWLLAIGLATLAGLALTAACAYWILVG